MISENLEELTKIAGYTAEGLLQCRVGRTLYDSTEQELELCKDLTPKSKFTWKPKWHGSREPE